MAAWAVFWLDSQFSSVGGQLVCPRFYVALLGPTLLPTELSGPESSGKGGGEWTAGEAHLLSGGQTVLCCAQDAADEAELL